MYELIYILPINYDEKKAGTATRSIIKLITDKNGALVKDDFLGEKMLQYPVKGHERGKYFLMEFTVPVDHLEKLKRVFNLNKEIVRYLLTKKEVRTEKIREKPGSKLKKGEDKKETKSKKKEYSIVKSAEEKEREEKRDKTKLEDLDKKLEEILN